MCQLTDQNPSGLVLMLKNEMRNHRKKFIADKNMMLLNQNAVFDA
jgi:hypothetical protein